MNYIWIHRNGLSHLHIFREEMKKVMTMSYIGGSFEGFFFTSAKLVVFLILLSYVMVGGTITVKKVYLMVTLVQIIMFSTTLFIPFAFRFGFEILVTLRRYQVCVQFFVSFWFRNCFFRFDYFIVFLYLLHQLIPYSNNIHQNAYNFYTPCWFSKHVVMQLN